MTTRLKIILGIYGYALNRNSAPPLGFESIGVQSYILYCFGSQNPDFNQNAKN